MTLIRPKTQYLDLFLGIQHHTGTYWDFTYSESDKESLEL